MSFFYLISGRMDSLVSINYEANIHFLFCNIRNYEEVEINMKIGQAESYMYNVLNEMLNQYNYG